MWRKREQPARGVHTRDRNESRNLTSCKEGIDRRHGELKARETTTAGSTTPTQSTRATNEKPSVRPGGCHEMA